MKRTLMVLAILSVVLLTAVAGAFANTPSRMRVNIGFSFYANNELLPAGEYLIEIRSINGTLAGSPMAICDRDNTNCQFLNATAVGSNERNGSYSAVFTRIGGSYFLTKVNHGDLQGSLPKSRTQKEFKTAAAAGSGVAEETVIIAAAR